VLGGIMSEKNCHYFKTSFPIKISELDRIESGVKVFVGGRIISTLGKTFLKDSTGVIELYRKKGNYLSELGDLSLICGILIKRKGKVGIKNFNIVGTITLSPGNLSTTFNNKPEIYCLLNINYLLNKYSTIMYVDNNKITYVNVDNKIKYNPNSPLSPGEHYVSLVFSDNLGNVRSINWMFNIESEDKCCKLFFGVPHCHTCISDGRGMPDKAIDYTHRNSLDFLFITDHSNFFDGVRKDNYELDRQCNEYREIIGSDWYNTGAVVKEYNSTHKDFIALRGFEMSSESWGHINVLNSNSYVEAKHQTKLIEDFFLWIKKQNDAAAVINHPGSHFKNVISHLEMDGIISLIEVGNGAFPRKYRRFEKYYYNALDNG
jgi:hypothetical protein